jgi:hypothetical protein
LLKMIADGEQLHRPVRASLRVLDVAPKHIAFPLLAAVHRAAVGEAAEQAERRSKPASVLNQR